MEDAGHLANLIFPNDLNYPHYFSPANSFLSPWETLLLYKHGKSRVMRAGRGEGNSPFWWGLTWKAHDMEYETLQGAQVAADVSHAWGGHCSGLQKSETTLPLEQWGAWPSFGVGWP